MTLDAKGRLTVPVQAKDVLMAAEKGQLVVCKGFKECLCLFPASFWPQVEEMLAELGEDEKGAETKRLIMGSAADLVIDGASRVTIPPELREYAGLEREVVFMGLGNYFELWDKTKRTVEERRFVASEGPSVAASSISFGKLKRVVAS